ncbi:MAG: hypothetical protein ACE1S7_04045 [Candidatus Tisiphia sp.]
MVTGNESPTITSRDKALKEINRLESDTEFMVKLNRQDHTGYNQVVKRMEELYKIAYDKTQ